MAASLTGCILVAPHAYAYDASILLLAVWLVLFVSKDRYSRLAAATLAIPLPFIAYVGGGLWRMTPAVVILLLLVALARGELLGAARRPGFVKEKPRISKARSALQN